MAQDVPCSSLFLGFHGLHSFNLAKVDPLLYRIEVDAELSNVERVKALVVDGI